MYFIDAHSQWDHRVDEERVLSLMNHGGVYRTLLSVHLKRPWVEVVAFGHSTSKDIREVADRYVDIAAYVPELCESK